jgi:hypothetical protein
MMFFPVLILVVLFVATRGSIVLVYSHVGFTPSWISLGLRSRRLGSVIGTQVLTTNSCDCFDMVSPDHLTANLYNQVYASLKPSLAQVPYSFFETSHRSLQTADTGSL